MGEEEVEKTEGVALPVERCAEYRRQLIFVIYICTPNFKIVMKHIIVPYDFSDEARNGIALARVLATQTLADIQLVYVQRKQPDFAHLSLAEERKLVESEFQNLLAEITPTLPQGVKIDYIIKKGKVYQEVVAQADAFNESVIVTSTHGASGFEEFFLGSNTLKILSSTEVPVYTIRHGIVPVPLRDIIFPLDTTFESRQKAPVVVKLAKQWGATVHIVTTTDGYDAEEIKKLQAYIAQCEEYFVKNDVMYVTYRAEREDFIYVITAYASKLPSSLVTITTRDKSVPSFFMIGEKAQRLLRKSPVPVLVVVPTLVRITDSFRTQGA